MKACVYEEYGPPEVVHVEEVADPDPGPTDLLVDVRAAEVTTADHRFRSAEFPGGFWLAGRLLVGLWRPRHRILGMHFAGVVRKVGSKVSRFRPGDRIFGATSRGAHAEQVTVAESGAVIATPATLTDAEAASLPFGGCSALAFMRDVGRVKPGQRVLVVGASGSVGALAIQIARHLGAEVTGVASGPNLDLVRSLGAHHVVDYRSGTIFERGARYDLVFDTIGVTTFAACRPALTEGGAFLPLNATVLDLLRSVTMRLGRGPRIVAGISQNDVPALTELVALVESGALRPVVDRVYPLDRIVDAHRHVDGRHKRGAVVVGT